MAQPSPAAQAAVLLQMPVLRQGAVLGASLDHVGIVHDEILMEEFGADPDEKWNQVFGRVENLARRGLRYVQSQRVTQHFEGVKDFLRECDRPDMIGLLDRAIKYAFSEAMVQLSQQETYLPERTTPIVKSMLAELRSAPAYANSGKLALFNPLRQAQDYLLFSSNVLSLGCDMLFIWMHHAFWLVPSAAIQTRCVLVNLKQMTEPRSPTKCVGQPGKKQNK